MIKKEIEKLVFDKFYDIIKNLGYELVEVKWTKVHDNFNLTFFIDNLNGIKIEDCEIVHKTVDPILDEIDISNNQPYTLNVSSSGLDREIVTKWDIEKYKNKEVVLKLYKPYLKSKELVCTFVDKTEDKVIVEINGEQIQFNNNEVVFVKPYIKF